jgi:hypothetical protein
MFLAAARRFVLLLLLASVTTTVLALLFGALLGSSVARAVSVGFYLMGSFLLVAGFFVGNRGPARRSDAGSRVLRWASLDEQEHTINMSALFVVLGFALVMIGIAIDSRYSLF